MLQTITYCVCCTVQHSPTWAFSWLNAMQHRPHLIASACNTHTIHHFMFCRAGPSPTPHTWQRRRLCWHPHPRIPPHHPRTTGCRRRSGACSAHAPLPARQRPRPPTGAPSAGPGAAWRAQCWAATGWRRSGGPRGKTGGRGAQPRRRGQAAGTRQGSRRGLPASPPARPAGREQGKGGGKGQRQQPRDRAPIRMLHLQRGLACCARGVVAHAASHSNPTVHSGYQRFPQLKPVCAHCKRCAMCLHDDAAAHGASPGASLLIGMKGTRHA